MPGRAPDARPAGRTIDVRRFSQRELDAGRRAFPETFDRPKTRGDCINGPRPCPFVGCKHNLYLDVHPRLGNIKLNFPELQPDEMLVSCALDVADIGEHGLEEVGVLMNLSRERTRQVEEKVLRRLKRVGRRLREHLR